MAEQLHDHPRVHVLAEQQGGGGVPAVVQPHVPDAGGLQQTGPVVVVGLLVHRAAVGLGEDQVLVVPVGAGLHPLAELGGLVVLQLGDEGERQGQGALAAPGLGLLVDQPAAADAVDAAPNREGAGQQVDVLPLQGQRLGLPQAEGESDGPAGRVPRVSGRGQDGAGLAEVEGGGDVALLLRRWVDEGDDVAGDVTPLDGDGQRPGQDPVLAQDRGGGVTVVEHRRVERVQVLGPQLVEPVPADAGHQVLADGGLVALQRALAYAARCDGGQPVLQPGRNGRGRGGAERAVGPLALDVADLGDDDGAGLAGDVPPVGLAGDRGADGDVTVPATVGGLVDRRLTVGRASCHHSLLCSVGAVWSGRSLVASTTVNSGAWSTGGWTRGRRRGRGAGLSSRRT
ncbi:hypothetical protein NH342_07080 [Klenkia sp. PcliD-1-E]|nr:hypothetical protein [Klenkia sp. PcliD-1-E]MCO7219575.1 hypothetical protein [Klenkia sp. PcliD-1-E]